MERSFTLVELLVVTSIILLLGGLIFPSYRAGERLFALQRSAHKLNQDIRRAQQMAMSAKEIGPAGAKIVPRGGYGIYLKTPMEIILFADCDRNREYTTGNVCGTPPNQFPEKIEDITLERGVQIQNLSPSSPLNITFEPPDPIVFLPPHSITVIITLSLEGEPSKIRTITVNRAGLIALQ